MNTWQKYLAEVFGTLVLVGIGTGSILAALATDTPLMAAVPLGFGFALLMALYSVGEVSGGHFNPAVTLAMFMDRRINFGDLVGYWIAQITGGILGSWFIAILLSRAAVGLTTTNPGAGVGDGQAFFGEVLFTMAFVFVILAVTKSGMAKQSFVAISLGLAGVHYIGVPLTGASVNPARSFAPFVIGDVASRDGGQLLLLYIVGPLVGAIVAWFFYKIIVQGDLDFRDDFRETKDAITE